MQQGPGLTAGTYHAPSDQDQMGGDGPFCTLSDSVVRAIHQPAISQGGSVAKGFRMTTGVARLRLAPHTPPHATRLLPLTPPTLTSSARSYGLTLSVAGPYRERE